MDPTHVVDKALRCTGCEVPICRRCYSDLTKARLPELSYANDMFTGYALKRIYADQVTAMELICASPALTSMILMSMESRHRNQSHVAAFDETAHMARHRYGARGNVITFPLPTEEVLRALNDFLDSDAPLPRCGKQLGDIVRVILRTNKDGNTTEEEIKTLIHQATVRRQAGGYAGACEYECVFLRAHIRRICCLYAFVSVIGGGGLDLGHEDAWQPRLRELERRRCTGKCESVAGAWRSAGGVGGYPGGG